MYTEKGNYHANYRLQIYTSRNCYNVMSWQGGGPWRDTQARRDVLKELANSEKKKCISERAPDTSMRAVTLSSKPFLNYHSFGNDFVLLRLCSQLS